MRIIVGLLEHMGDIVACEPVSRFLKEKHPNGHLIWAVSPPYRELIDANPHIDETLVLECLTDWIKLTRHAEYDQVVDLHVNYRICPDCRIPLVKTGGNPCVTAFDWFDFGTLLEAFSIGACLPPLSAAPQIYVQEEHRKAVDQLRLPDDFCVVHTISNDPTKDWDRQSWEALSESIHNDLKIPIVEVGAGRHVDPPLRDQGYISLINRLPILQTAEVIRRARFFIGIDSGPAHLANAVKTPGVILLGQLGYFRKYMPFNGFFASDTPHVRLVRNLTGPVREIAVAEVAEATRYVSAVCSHGEPTRTRAKETEEQLSEQFENNAKKIDEEDRQTLLSSGFFDGNWYKIHYSDASASELDPLDHFILIGGPAGYAPGPEFDTSRYLKMYGDVQRHGGNPLLHYLRAGKNEGRTHYRVRDSHLNSAPTRTENERTTETTVSELLPELRLRDCDSGLKQSMMSTEYPRTFAFYLPQFHPIPENDWAHGPGFSEWHNVIKAKPLFRGHYQPRIPGELGFYDLRSSEVLDRQIDLARKHGITGFCFYYYYFHGKKVLYRPIENFLKSKDNFPFFLLWANENWTRRWDGGENEIIIAQQHSSEDDLAFIRQLLPIFHDRRYVKIEGKPILMVYKSHLFPSIRSTTELWRDEAEKHGFPGLYLVMVDDWQDLGHPREQGFDASYEIPSNLLPEEVSYTDLEMLDLDKEFAGRIVDYAKFATFHMSRPSPEYKRFRTVMLPWDNTARYGSRAIVHVDNSVDTYKLWLTGVLLDTYTRQAAEERIVFLHSWNEWCEGTYLEPDGRLGRQFLEQTREAIRTVNDAIDISRQPAKHTPKIAEMLRVMRAKEEGAFRALKATRARMGNMFEELEKTRRETERLRAEWLTELERIHEENAQLISQRDALYASTSWRATARLRMITRRLRGESI
jgi:hypothetical protein